MGKEHALLTFENVSTDERGVEYANPLFRDKQRALSHFILDPNV